eukprot:2708523-Prymnesium_polylepis.1
MPARGWPACILPRYRDACTPWAASARDEKVCRRCARRGHGWRRFWQQWCALWRELFCLNN